MKITVPINAGVVVLLTIVSMMMYFLMLHVFWSTMTFEPERVDYSQREALLDAYMFPDPIEVEITQYPEYKSDGLHYSVSPER